MTEKLLHIVIFDGSFKTTPFINRLAQGLSTKHAVYIMGFNETLSHKIEKITYVSLGSNDSKFRFALTSLLWIFKSGKINLLIPTLKNLVNGKRSILQNQNLKLALKKINPNIIHLQWPAVISNFEEVLLQQTYPVVLSQRGYHSNIRPFVNAANYEYLKKWYPKMAGFHSVSKAISKEGDKIYKSSNKIDEVVYTGIDLKEFAEPESFSVNGIIKLLSVGRPHWIKGYRYALLACYLLKEKNIPFHYTIIGGFGNEELVFLIDDLGLNSEVTLAKKMQQVEVFHNMKKSNLLLLPSVKEGIANVVVEAMALGLPIVSTNCGGMQEVIENEKLGWKVPLRNPEALADAILAFMTKTRTTIEDIRLKAREKVEKQHNEVKMVDDMEVLYKMVINEFYR